MSARPNWYAQLTSLDERSTRPKTADRHAQLGIGQGPHYTAPHFDVPANPESVLPVRGEFTIEDPTESSEGEVRQVSAATLDDLDRLVYQAGVTTIDSATGTAMGSYDVDRDAVLRFEAPTAELMRVVATLANPATRAKVLENGAYARGYETGMGRQAYSPPTQGGELADQFAEGVADGAKARHNVPL